MGRGSLRAVQVEHNRQRWRVSPAWGYYQFQRDEFLPHYHKRSNVETTFFMIKTKFGGKLWSKSETGRVNEALLKVLCHNIVVLVQSIYELDIEQYMALESGSDNSEPDLHLPCTGERRSYVHRGNDLPFVALARCPGP